MRSRTLMLALVLVVSRSLGAQQPPSTVPPLPPIGLPLAPIGLPPPTITPALPHFGSPPTPVDVTAPPRRHHAERRSHRGMTGHSSPLVVVVPDPYGWLTGPIDRPPQTGEIPSPPRDTRETGRLRLDVEPADAQVFIDSVYVGTQYDLSTIELDPGIYRLAIVASGRETVSMDIRITAGETLSYRDTLKRQSAPMPPPAAPDPRRPARTIYVLRGCYVGDVPPAPGTLPARCDLDEMLTYTTGETGGSASNP